jgi:hypothetical protein
LQIKIGEKGIKNIGVNTVSNILNASFAIVNYSAPGIREGAAKPHMILQRATRSM